MGSPTKRSAAKTAANAVTLGPIRTASPVETTCTGHGRRNREGPMTTPRWASDLVCQTNPAAWTVAAAWELGTSEHHGGRRHNGTTLDSGVEIRAAHRGNGSCPRRSSPAGNSLNRVGVCSPVSWDKSCVQALLVTFVLDQALRDPTNLAGVQPLGEERQ